MNKKKKDRRSALPRIWHYRVFKIIKGPEEYFCIKEYYPRAHRGAAVWTSNSCAPFGKTKKELIRDLGMMLQDARKYSIKIEKYKHEGRRK